MCRGGRAGGSFRNDPPPLVGPDWVGGVVSTRIVFCWLCCVLLPFLLCSARDTGWCSDLTARSTVQREIRTNPSMSFKNWYLYFSKVFMQFGRHITCLERQFQRQTHWLKQDNPTNTVAKVRDIHKVGQNEPHDKPGAGVEAHCHLHVLLSVLICMSFA